MSANRIVSQLPKQVKPILSLNPTEAKYRVLNLYRAWHRSIPYIIHDMRLHITDKQLKDKVRELIMKNKDITDVRVIDMLVIKGQMELNETVNKYKQECHVMNYFKETIAPRPKDFISRFLHGKDSE